MYFKILQFLKKNIDKRYYNYYSMDRETLIREMFPWISKIWEYNELDLFLKNTTVSSTATLMKVIWTFYWWEVNRLTAEWKFSEIEKYQWLLEFVQAVRDYQEYILTIK